MFVVSYENYGSNGGEQKPKRTWWNCKVYWREINWETCELIYIQREIVTDGNYSNNGWGEESPN